MDKSEFSLLPFISKKCSICEKEFKPRQSGQNICSWACRQIKVKENGRYIMRLRRHRQDRFKPCWTCGYSLTSDRHHEGSKVYILCPNCHALITRGIKTIDDLFKERVIRLLKERDEKVVIKPV